MSCIKFSKKFEIFFAFTYDLSIPLHMIRFCLRNVFDPTFTEHQKDVTWWSQAWFSSSNNFQCCDKVHNDWNVMDKTAITWFWCEDQGGENCKGRLKN